MHWISCTGSVAQDQFNRISRTDQIHCITMTGSVASDEPNQLHVLASDDSGLEALVVVSMYVQYLEQ